MPLRILVFLFGPPGAGKSTFINRLIELHPETFRLSRDCVDGTLINSPRDTQYSKLMEQINGNELKPSTEKEKAYEGILRLADDNIKSRPSDIVLIAEGGWGSRFRDGADYLEPYLGGISKNGKQPVDFAVCGIHMYCSDVELAYCRVQKRNEDRDSARLQNIDVFRAEQAWSIKVNAAGIAAVRNRIKVIEFDTKDLELSFARSTDPNNFCFRPLLESEIAAAKQSYIAKVKEVMVRIRNINNDFAATIDRPSRVLFKTPPPVSASPLTITSSGSTPRQNYVSDKEERERMDSPYAYNESKRMKVRAWSLNTELNNPSLLHRGGGLLPPPIIMYRSASHGSHGPHSANNLKTHFSVPDLTSLNNEVNSPFRSQSTSFLTQRRLTLEDGISSGHHDFLGFPMDAPMEIEDSDDATSPRPPIVRA